MLIFYPEPTIPPSAPQAFKDAKNKSRFWIATANTVHVDDLKKTQRPIIVDENNTIDFQMVGPVQPIP